MARRKTPPLEAVEGFEAKVRNAVVEEDMTALFARRRADGRAGEVVPELKDQLVSSYETGKAFAYRSLTAGEARRLRTQANNVAAELGIGVGVRFIIDGADYTVMPKDIEDSREGIDVGLLGKNRRNTKRKKVREAENVSDSVENVEDVTDHSADGQEGYQEYQGYDGVTEAVE